MAVFEITTANLKMGHLVYKQNYIYIRNGIKKQYKSSYTLHCFSKVMGWSQL